MNFESQQEAIEHYIKNANMSEVEAKKYVENDPILKKLPETKPKEQVKVVDYKEVKADFDDVNSKQSGFEAMLEEQGILLKSLTDKLEAAEKELVLRKSEISIKPSEEEENFGFKSMADFALNAKQSAHGHTPKMAAYAEKCANMELELKAAGDPSMVTFDDGDGGFLIPTPMSREVLKNETEKSEFFKKARQIPMTSQSLDIPSVSGFDQSGGVLHGNVLVLSKAELAQFTEKNVKFGSTNLKLNKVTGLAFVSDEMMKFSPISATAILTDTFSDALIYRKDKFCISGTGADEPVGILNADAKIEVTVDGGQTADTIIPLNIVRMRARAWGATRDLMFIANPDTLPQLYLMTIDVGTGGSVVFMPNNSMSGVPHDTLMGIPLVFSDHMKTLGDAGDIALVNWREYLWARSTIGVSTDTSMHLKFDFAQTAFRIIEYMDGQSWWSSALTPENSAKTRSPMVIIPARA